VKESLSSGDTQVGHLMSYNYPANETVASEQVVVGTHALLQPSVVFDNLGLLVIDEEQRFGVAHKEKLKTCRSGTDVLTLSATPIPRTLQMALTGLRDMSLVNSPPAGRREVEVTVRVDDDEAIRSVLARELDRGGQAFVVVPFVQLVAGARERMERLMGNRAKCIEAHGRHEDLEERIDRFAAGQVGKTAFVTSPRYSDGPS